MAKNMTIAGALLRARELKADGKTSIEISEILNKEEFAKFKRQNAEQDWTPALLQQMGVF